MQELIPIHNDGKGGKTVSARELYEGLFEADMRDFSKWCSRNIIKNPFAFESADYQILRTLAENNGRPGIDYLLTIEFAKKLCMVTKTKKGEEIREYFLQMEQIAQDSVVAHSLPQTFSQALRMLADKTDELDAAKGQLQIAQPKAESFDLFMNAENACTMNDVAKALYKKLKLGRNKMFEQLRERKILMKNNTPMQHYVDCGYFAVQLNAIKMGGKVKNIPQVKVLPRGVEFIRKTFNV